ncbi:hypothetical protein [Phytopseudomonas dryadis]|uniref:hypothetical protein n=1 Tax=Phytopseudomonas dryadis TaxID=2487520 RepID=UPI00241843E7|nr:hypothetical protein [Pseudomonas dryadis]
MNGGGGTPQAHRDRDRRLCERVRNADPLQLSGTPGRSRIILPELLFRYRARNFPATLNADEQQRWRDFCRQRLTRPEHGAPNTLASFEAALNDALPVATERQRKGLEEWREYARQLRQRYAL